MTPNRMDSPRFAAMQWLSFAAVAAALLYLLSPILTPFVAAGILAYICNPLVQRMSARKMPRTLAVVLVMGGLLLLSGLLLLIMLPLLEKEIGLFVRACRTGSRRRAFTCCRSCSNGSASALNGIARH